MKLFWYIFVMAGVTYLIRMIPFTLFRRPIRSRFFRGFLHYIPYAVLSAMTIPAVFYATEHILSAAVGVAVAVILALKKKPLTVVAVFACLAVFLTELFL